MRDKEFGAVRVTAYGLYSLRVKDYGTFIQEIVGTDGNFTTEGIEENLRGKIGLRIKEVMPEAGIPVLDLEGKVVTLGEILKERIAPAFDKFGLELTEVQVQDIGLPEEVERAIDKGGAMRAMGNLQAYTQYETASAIGDAARNPSGTAGAGMGMGMGMGFAMANQMTQSMGASQQQAQQGAGAAPPPPLPSAAQFFAAIDGKQAGPFDMAALEGMITSGQINKSALVWKQGMAVWTKAGEVGDVSGLFDKSLLPIPA